MEKKSILMLAILTVLLLGVPTTSAQTVSWAEWHFTSGFTNDEVMADSASDQDSLLRLNTPGSAVYTIAGGVLSCTGSADLNEWLQMDVDDMVENGGGIYVNEYSMVWDIRSDSTPDWIGLYNTNDANANPAELWLADDGSVGKGGDYSAPGVVPPQTWVRIVATYRVQGGNMVENLYVDGTNVLANTVRDVVDGYWSLWTNAQNPSHQVAVFGAEDSGIMYLDAFDLENYGIITTELSAAQVASLGGYDPNGIGLENMIEPTVDIKVNGSDGPVTVNWGTMLMVDISVDPGSEAGNNADWWVLADSPFGWYHFDLGIFFWASGFQVTYQAPLFALAPFTVYGGTSLPVGSYTLYFGVDMNMNGILDVGETYYDSVDLTIQ